MWRGSPSLHPPSPVDAYLEGAAADAGLYEHRELVAADRVDDHARVVRGAMRRGGARPHQEDSRPSPMICRGQRKIVGGAGRVRRARTPPATVQFADVAVTREVSERPAGEVVDTGEHIRLR